MMVMIVMSPAAEPSGSVTYGHPEGSAAGDITIITIIWNDVFK